MPSTIIPCLAYRDAPAAIEWLCKVIGFAKHAVYPDDKGGVAHAELTLGGGILMLGSINDGPFGKHIAQPSDIGNRETQAPYIVVADADAVYNSAKTAGAEIVIEIRDESYGGRGCAFRDLEGHLWTVGTYDPWASKPAG